MLIVRAAYLEEKDIFSSLSELSNKKFKHAVLAQFFCMSNKNVHVNVFFIFRNAVFNMMFSTSFGKEARIFHQILVTTFCFWLLKRKIGAVCS